MVLGMCKRPAIELTTIHVIVRMYEDVQQVYANSPAFPKNLWPTLSDIYIPTKPTLPMCTATFHKPWMAAVMCCRTSMLVHITRLPRQHRPKNAITWFTHDIRQVTHTVFILAFTLVPSSQGLVEISPAKVCHSRLST